MKTLLTTLTLFFATIFCNAQNLSFTLNQQPCNNDGIVTTNVTGLTPPLTFNYTMNGSTSIIHGGVNTTSDQLTNYDGTPMSVYVTGNGGTAIGYYSALLFNLTPNNITTTPASCTVLGTATVSGITGGTAPYSYEWINSQTQTVVSSTNPANLPHGIYNLKVSDNAGCNYTFKDSVLQVYINQLQTIFYSVGSTIASCTNGTATVSPPTGGTPPYTYLWSNGATTQSINNLLSGAYSITVMDALGCTQLENTYVPQSITINVPVTSTNATCIQSNGSAIAFGAGGTPPYSYQWSNALIGQSISNVLVGSYSVVATDANGCIGTGYTYINSTTPITVNYSTTNSLCTTPTGSATLTIAGGTPPYSVIWNTYPSQTGITATNLGIGQYGFSVTDAVGCVQNGIVYISSANPLYAYSMPTNAMCLTPTGSAGVNVSGGTPPYTYLWSNGATTPTISNLMPGNTYHVLVTDNVSCKVTKYATIGSNSPINLGVSTTPASCIFTNDGTATLNISGGLAPYTYNWVGGNVSSANNLGAGVYSAYVTDVNGCFANIPYFTVGNNATANNCFCTINGTVYHDANNNCIQEAGEVGIPNIQIYCSGIGYVYTDANGVYSFIVPSGTYTLSESVQTLYPLSACQNNAISVTATATSGCVITHDFANTINPLHDIHTKLWDITNAVPGNVHQQKSIVSNLGTITESPLASISTDGQLNTATIIGNTPFTLVNPNNYSTSASSTFSLTPGQNSVSIVSYNVPTNIPLATNVVCKDSASYLAPMSNWLNDYTPWDNVEYQNSTIVGSFDPNFKEVSPKGVGASGDIFAKDSILDYMVHFQNVGTYYAQNVVVLDTLDADLDWTTLRPVYQSHDCKVTIDINGVAKFEFKNIHLSPESYNDGFSDGMFTYRIKHKNNLAVGTQIKNSASIYFDYNAPVKTNTTLNTIAAPAGITESNLLSSSLAIYPNPTNDLLNVSIEKQKIGQHVIVSIVDITGKIVKENSYVINSDKQIETIQVNQLSTGMYFVELHSLSGKYSSKFIKN